MELQDTTMMPNWRTNEKVQIDFSNIIITFIMSQLPFLLCSILYGDYEKDLSHE
jgi:hypothetical protein